MSRVHERYRRQTTDRQTDGRATAYSERERDDRECEFMFVKKIGSFSQNGERRSSDEK